MSLKLNIDRLVIETTAMRRLDGASLKAAVERQLAALIEADGLPTMASTWVKTVAPGAARPIDAARGEARLARDLAQRIHEGMKR